MIYLDEFLPSDIPQKFQSLVPNEHIIITIYLHVCIYKFHRPKEENHEQCVLHICLVQGSTKNVMLKH